MASILSIVRRCLHCETDLTDVVSPASYRENPFCCGCLSDRLEAVRRQVGLVENRQDGHYLVAIPIQQKGS